MFIVMAKKAKRAKQAAGNKKETKRQAGGRAGGLAVSQITSVKTLLTDSLYIYKKSNLIIIIKR